MKVDFFLRKGGRLRKRKKLLESNKRVPFRGTKVLKIAQIKKERKLRSI